MKATQHVEASTHLPGQELTAFLWAERPPAQAPACLRSQSKTRGQTNGSSDYYWRPLVHGQLCRPCAEQLGLALADEAVDW